MGKTLIIAEKPSVATDLARVLGKQPGMSKFEKEKDYFENETHVISSAVGHLLELAFPEKDGKKPKWNFESLPLIPDQFELKPIERSADRLTLLKKLLKRSDVTEVINACDAGREGELIFRYIMQASGCRKPCRRLWMQSMTAGAITDAFAHLRDDGEMQPLADAAVCRSESDWLVGINGTRALTAYNSRNGGFLKTPVGRVQTPTLTILVNREKEIMAFQPRTYWEVFGDFSVAAGGYRGRWFDESFKKNEDVHAKPERLWDKAKADAIKARCDGKPGIVEEVRKPKKEACPLLFDLTSLQREASNKFGFSARRTLQIAQALYEAHKVLTYPRTDSRYLPEDYVPTVQGVMKGFAGLDHTSIDAFPSDLPQHAGKVVSQKWIFPTKRIFDNGKVSDHFAIIPTGVVPKHLKPEEMRIYDLVVRRFIAIFFPQAEFEIATRITRIAQDAFKTEGKILVVPGWLEVYGKQAIGEGEGPLVPVKAGETAQTRSIEVVESVTRPPARYNEATLLSAMEGAGKLVDDEELAEAMSERGLGTPATRAAIIEGLVEDQYIARNGRELVATPKGITLIDQLAEIGVEALTSPQMTGEWEFKLKQMEHGRLSRDKFMNEIKRLTSEVVSKTREHTHIAKNREYSDLAAKCPVCGAGSLKQTDKFFQCRECDFKMGKMVASRYLNEEEAKQLLEQKLVGPLEGFRNKFGQEFNASLILDKDMKVGFQFEKTEVQERAQEALTNPANAICPCPVCAKAGRSAMIYETEDAYLCESVIRGETPCKPKGKLSREMCQFRIPREQAVKFFTDGKTDLINKFISKKGRPFSAHLVCSTEGKMVLGWEFPEREPKLDENGQPVKPKGRYPVRNKAAAKK
jgi:DNA topoisomerase-3